MMWAIINLVFTVAAFLIMFLTRKTNLAWIIILLIGCATSSSFIIVPVYLIMEFRPKSTSTQQVTQYSPDGSYITYAPQVPEKNQSPIVSVFKVVGILAAIGIAAFGLFIVAVILLFISAPTPSHSSGNGKGAA